MKKIISASLFFLIPLTLQAQLKIVATIPDLADIAKRIGGDLVSIETLAKGTEDIHAVPQRPSFIPKLASADGVVHLGLWAEHAFLPALIEASANSKLQPGQIGDIDCSSYVSAVDIPAVISRDQGEQHPDGNPHYNTDPRKGTAISRAIAEKFSKLDPKNSSIYEKNRVAFDQALAEKIKEWDRKLSSLKGIKAVAYHKDMAYFSNYLGISLIGEIELKPGIAPSPRHLEELVVQMKQENAKLILFEIQYSDKTAKWLAEQTGAKIAPVATMGGAFPDSNTYFGMIEHNLNSVLEVIK
jgi:zinc/manganese transport system substrate-binding protein